jgi:hypothetical protein
MGVLHPIVLLPTTWRDWDDAKLDAVIAHELSHIARRDTLTQRLSLLHCTIFWFSPLAWWLNRHLADLMEQASDEAALSCGVERKAYAMTLLSFFEALQGTPRRVWWQHVSMASAGRAGGCAEERVERILVWNGAAAMSLKKSIAILVLAPAVPVVYLTASAHPAYGKTDPQGINVVEVAQNQATPAPPQASHAALAARKSSNHNSYSYGYDDNLRFAIVSGKNNTMTMSGMNEDWEQFGQLKKKIQGDFIWFRRDGESYVSRDQATIDRAKAFWAHKRARQETGRTRPDSRKRWETTGRARRKNGKDSSESSRYDTGP